MSSCQRYSNLGTAAVYPRSAVRLSGKRTDIIAHLGVLRPAPNATLQGTESPEREETIGLNGTVTAPDEACTDYYNQD